MGMPGTLKVLADWTDRIAKGEVPPAPPRPKGVERNVVVTLWDVGDDHSFMHDEISTDKNHPTVNAGGPVYAVNAGHGQLVVMNPKENSTFSMDIPTRAPRDQVPSRFPAPAVALTALGQRASVGQSSVQSRRSAQSDARQQGPRVDDVEDSRQPGAGLVQRRDAREQVRRLVPAQEQRPAGVVLRSQDAEVAADRHLLQHAPPAVRQRCQRDAVFQRAERPDVRLDRHEGVR